MTTAVFVLWVLQSTATPPGFKWNVVGAAPTMKQCEALATPENLTNMLDSYACVRYGQRPQL